MKAFGAPGLRLELVFIVGGLTATAHSAMMIVIPAMPEFIGLIGGGAIALGFSFSAQAIGRVLTNIPAGAISEKVGRKWVIVVGGVGIAVFSTASGLAENVPAFLALRFFIGVFSATTIVVANVVAADLSTVENRGRVLGMMHGVQLVVGTASPGIGGLVAELVGTRAPFFLSGIGVMLFALWAVMRLPETRPTTPEANPAHSHGNSPRAALFLLRDPSFFAVCMIGFSTFFLRGGSSASLIPLFADEVLMMGPGFIGLLLMVSSGLHSILIYPAGAISDRMGRKIIIVPAGVAVGLALFLLPFAQTVLPFVAFFIMLHAAQGWGGQAPVAYVADLAPPGTRGMAIGLYRTFGDAAGFVGPVIATSLVAVSFHAAFWSGAVLWMATIIVFAYVAKETAGNRRVRGPVTARQPEPASADPPS